MARKKRTPEERRAWQARHEKTQRMVAERIAYHEAKAREEEEERAKRAS